MSKTYRRENYKRIRREVAPPSKVFKDRRVRRTKDQLRDEVEREIWAYQEEERGG